MGMKDEEPANYDFAVGPDNEFKAADTEAYTEEECEEEVEEEEPAPFLPAIMKDEEMPAEEEADCYDEAAEDWNEPSDLDNILAPMKDSNPFDYDNAFAEDSEIFSDAPNDMEEECEY